MVFIQKNSLTKQLSVIVVLSSYNETIPNLTYPCPLGINSTDISMEMLEL